MLSCLSILNVCTLFSADKKVHKINPAVRTVIIVTQLSTISKIPGQKIVFQTHITPEKRAFTMGDIISKKEATNLSAEVTTVTMAPPPGSQDRIAVTPASPVIQGNQVLNRVCRYVIIWFCRVERTGRGPSSCLSILHH